MKRIRMRLENIAFSARDINLFTFKPVGETVLPSAEPGAHIDLFLRPNLIRQYSLLRPSACPQSYVIGVKKDPASRGGSRFMHEQLRVGDEIEISAPRNNFPLAEDAEHSVLLAGGIGITPIWAMAQKLEALGKSWRLYVSNRTRLDAALLEEMSASPHVTLHFDDEAGALLDIAVIIAASPPQTHFYCCGPAPMLRAYRSASAQIPAAYVHDEAFALSPPSPETVSAFVVRLAQSGRDIAIAADRSILDTLRDNGVEAASSCEAGVCGMCETRVLEGDVDHRDHVLTPAEQAENTRMMICCSRAKSNLLVLDL